MEGSPLKRDKIENAPMQNKEKCPMSRVDPSGLPCRGLTPPVCPRPETTNWTRPGTEGFLVREMRKGLLNIPYFDNSLDPDG